ncbi:MAG: PKD domain-containing protein [Dysgonamonadaceae bacterium]|jgi:PKD repeat protein|nr:PKD domain-containing protein [Dysgonamonadaceae bacterium]
MRINYSGKFCFFSIGLICLMSYDAVVFAQNPSNLSHSALASSLPATVTATISGTASGCAGKEYIFTSNGTKNNIDYTWSVTNGTIIWGQGTNEIGAIFTQNGTVTLKYKAPDGSLSNEASFNISIDAVPVFAPFTVPGDCSGNLLAVNPVAPAITGTYTGAPFWTLDGMTIDPNTYRTSDPDNGKALRYNVNTAHCGVASGDPVAITVKSRPAIVDVMGLPDTICSSSQINATALIAHNGAQPLTYRWLLDNVEIGNTDKLVYTPPLGDHGKVVTLTVGNECGTVTSTYTTVISGNKTTASNAMLPLKVDVPNGYFTRPVDEANIEEMQLPDKYWENTNYIFYTLDKTTYTDGQEIWLNRTGINDQWTHSTSGVGYKFTVWVANTNVFSGLRSRTSINNTTIVLDEGEYLFNMPQEVFIINSWDTGVKLFGLKNVALKPTVTGSSLTQGFRIAGTSQNVVENIIIDGGANIFSEYAFIISEENTPAFRIDYLTMKDITVRNVVSRASNSNRAVVAFIGVNGRGASYGAKTQMTYVRIHNLKVEETCTTTGTPNMGGLNGALQIYGASNLYFKDLDIRYTPNLISENALQITIGSSLPSPATNIVFDGLKMTADSIAVQRFIPHDLAFSSDYRYVRYQTSFLLTYNVLKLFKTMPGYYTSSNIVYDKLEGYWIIPSNTTTTARLNSLRTFYNSYKSNNNGSLVGAPKPNIKLVADANGEIRGFTVPDFGINEQVNIVAVKNATDPASQASQVVFNPISKINFNASGAVNVNLYNIDFDQKAKYTLPTVRNSIANANEGNFYNCTFSTYGNGEPLKINLANVPFTFSGAAVCTPDVVDLKNLTLVSGDTTGLTFKYYDTNDVELQNTVISAPGTTTYKIVGTHPKGCSYTATVNITVDTTIPTPAISGPVLVYTGAEFKYTGNDASASNYSWNTLNGSVLNGQGTNEAGISWSAAGTDEISLTYSLGTCSGTGTLEVKIVDSEILNKADFTIDKPTQCLSGNSYAFKNTAVVTPPNQLTGYLWNFGDNTSSTDASPVHKYSKGGTYTVTLIVYGSIANDTIAKTVSILSPAVERPADRAVCSGNPAEEIAFRGTAGNYSWKGGVSIGLPDGNDAVRIPSFTAKNDTDKPVTNAIVVTPVISTSDLTCNGDTVVFRITVNPLTVPSISGNTEVCPETENTYTTESGMSNYEWKITEGQVVSGGKSTDNSVTVRWNPVVRASISVNYTNNGNCRASAPATKTVTVHPGMYITMQPSEKLKLCAGDPLTLKVTAGAEQPVYQWYFNGKAISGAVGDTYHVARSKSSDSGEYYVTVSGPCNSVQSTTSGVSVDIPDIVVQKWENVLAVKCLPEENGGYEFATFQWYRNGNPIAGETKSHLYATGEIDYKAVYSVKLTTKNGLEYYTCERTFEPKNNVLIHAYPNPIGKGQMLQVEITGVNDDVPVEWILMDYKGVILQKQPMKGKQVSIKMPDFQGIYVLRVNINTPKPESKYFKIIVN